MTAQVTIREFDDRDIEGVIAVARDLQAHERQLFSRAKLPAELGTDYVHHIRKVAADHDGTFLVAEWGGQVVGYCTLLTHCDSSDQSDETFYAYAYVGDLGVRADQRSSGIGSMLIEEATRIARAAGLKWLRLSVLAANGGARRFYARNGFAEHLVEVEKAL